MHTSYAPDEITEDYIENQCDDLHDCLINVFNNDLDEEFNTQAESQINHLTAMLEEMINERRSMKL